MKKSLALILALIAALLLGCGPKTVENPEPPPPIEGRPMLHTPAVTARPEATATYLIQNATVLTGTGERIDNGYVLMVKGVIEYVGPDKPEVPNPATVFDVAGQWVTPGIIDTHSHIGVYPLPYVEGHADGNEATNPITADVSAEHSVWPQDPGLQRAVAGGITTLQILPGSANLIGGRSAVLKPHAATEAAALRFEEAPIGLKMACGENPKRVYEGRGPSTRMASTAAMRAAWTDAKAYNDEWDKYAKDYKKWADDGADESKKPSAPKPDLKRETLAQVLSGNILVHIHCYRADEMLLQIALAEEFGYEIRSFHHAVEAYKIAEVLAEKSISTSTWADWWGFKMEAYDAIVENAAILHAAGARAIIHSDSQRGIQRLNQEAAKALYRGKEAGFDIPEEDAIAWITLNAAWALGVDHITGSLEPQKMADVVVWSANPFSVYAKPELVFVEGILEHDASTPNPAWSDFEAGEEVR